MEVSTQVAQAPDPNLAIPQPHAGVRGAAWGAAFGMAAGVFTVIVLAAVLTAGNLITGGAASLVFASR